MPLSLIIIKELTDIRCHTIMELLFCDCRFRHWRRAAYHVMLLTIVVANGEYLSHYNIDRHVDQGGTPIFSCDVDGLALQVFSTPVSPPFYPYRVISSAFGIEWLSGGSYAISSGGSVLSALSGDLVPVPGSTLAGDSAGDDQALGPYSFLSIDWLAVSSNISFVTNFTCYSQPPLISWTLAFPTGLPDCALLNASAGLSPTALTSTRFPSFEADLLTTLRSSQMGFIEWAGEMTSYQSGHGVGLQGYLGGQMSGPLALYNTSSFSPGSGLKPQALVLGPLTSFQHSIIGVVHEDRAAGSPQPSSCGLAVPGTDEIGANHSPGYDNGAHTGTAAACCALCTRLGVAVCDAWVFDTSGPGGPDCWPIIGITGSKPASNRVLGFPAGRNVTCSAPMVNTRVVGGTPSAGLQAGLHVNSSASCCALCAILGPLSCGVWEFVEELDESPNCFPFSKIEGTQSAVNHTTAVAPGSVRLAAGVQAYITSLPPAFSTTFILATSAQGITDAVMRYGAALRSQHGTTRTPKQDDALRNKVSYWSDNGAYYMDMHWTKFFQVGLHTPETVFQQLKQYHASIGAHVGTYQMDPYWSYGVPPADCGTGGTWPWAANWSAPAQFFPSGLAALKLPLTLYSNMFAAPPNNKMTAFDWETGVVCNGGCPCSARVVPSQSYDFHSYIFDLGLQWGMTNFEIDFLDWMQLSFLDFAMDVRAFDEYFRGMGVAAAEHGITVQFCMLLPSLALSSVQWGAVTNARLQGDGNPYDTGRYDIFQSSLLYASLDLAPFVDNFWTTSVQPGRDSPWGNESEPFTEGYAVLSALSAGPVGFGDGIGFTNMTMLNLTCRADGVLLQPSLPATPLDFTFLDSFSQHAGGGARIASAPSFIVANASLPGSQGPYPYPPADGTNYWTSIVATYLSASIAIIPSDISPPLVESDLIGGFYATQLAVGLDRLETVCADGVAALLGCVAPFSSTQPLQISAVSHDVWSVCPVFASRSRADGLGWALVGELQKITRVSPTRFQSVTPNCAGDSTLCLQVVGVPGESTVIHLVAPGALVRAVHVPFDSTGIVSLLCRGTGVDSSCQTTLH